VSWVTCLGGCRFHFSVADFHSSWRRDGGSAINTGRLWHWPRRTELLVITAGAGSLGGTTFGGNKAVGSPTGKRPKLASKSLGRRRPSSSGTTKTIGVAHQLHLLLFTNMAHQDAARSMCGFSSLMSTSQVRCPPDVQLDMEVRIASCGRPERAGTSTCGSDGRLAV
jgi:hypothetical protein